MAGKVVLYEDNMQVSEVDPDGKRFDKGAHVGCPPCSLWPDDLCGVSVSRIRCRGDNWETDLSLDVNVDIYPLKVRVIS